MLSFSYMPNFDTVLFFTTKFHRARWKQRQPFTFWYCVDNFYPWKDLVGKMVSKLRSIAELGAFYGRLLISGIDNKLDLSSSVQTGATAVRAPPPITCSVEMRYLPPSLRPARNLKPSQMVSTSVANSDPNPDPDPLVFGAPGSGSLSQRYGSGSGTFYHHAKIMLRKTLIPTILWLFLTFYLWKIM